MAQNVTLMGASYSDVPAVELPKTGGGTATFTDTSDATATASDILSGKTAYVDGVKLTGTGSGGGEPDHWVRPSGFPDVSQLDRSGEVVYITCDASEDKGYITLNCRVTNNKNYNVEIGDIVNGVFVAEDSWVWAQYRGVSLYFGRATGGYRVFRITPVSGQHFTGFNVGETYEYVQSTGEYGNYTSHNVLGQYSGVVEVYGNLPYIQYGCSARTCRNLQSFDVTNVSPNSMNYAFAYDASLVNVNLSSWNTSNATDFASCFRGTSLKYCEGLNSLNVSKVTNFSNAFDSVPLETFDMTNWTFAKATGMNQMFINSKIKQIKLKSSDVSCNYSQMLTNCQYLEMADVTEFDTSLATNLTQLFNGCTRLKELDFASFDFSSITAIGNTASILNATRHIKSVTVPATMTLIGNYAFQNMEMCMEWHFLATTPPTLNNTNAFSGMNRVSGKKIYVPQGSLSAYQTASNWSTYAQYMVEEDPT